MFVCLYMHIYICREISMYIYIYIYVYIHEKHGRKWYYFGSCSESHTKETEVANETRRQWAVDNPEDRKRIQADIVAMAVKPVSDMIMKQVADKRSDVSMEAPVSQKVFEDFQWIILIRFVFYSDWL